MDGGVNLEDLRDGLVRALAVAQRRVDSLEQRLRCVQTTSKRCICRTASRACELNVELCVDQEREFVFPQRHESRIVPSSGDVVTLSLPEVEIPELRSSSSLLGEAYDEGQARGFEAGLAIGSLGEERALVELAATKRAAVEESAALRMQHARAVDLLRKERKERARIDGERENALKTAASAAERLEALRRELAVAKTKEFCFGRHAIALKAAMASMNRRHAEALEQALRARDVVSHKRSDAVLADAVKKALRRGSREDRRVRDELRRKVVDAVDFVCDQADQPLQLSGESRMAQPREEEKKEQPETKKHSYLKRGTAAARLRQKHLVHRNKRDDAPSTSSSSSSLDLHYRRHIIANTDGDFLLK